MHVSAVICTRNRPDLIGQAVRSVLANTYSSFDLLIVDQSDNDATRAVVCELMAEHPNLRYLHTPQAGLSRAYNLGIKNSSGEILAFTDDDCVAAPDWIATIVHAFAEEPDAEMLYGQVLRPSALYTCTDELPTLEFSEPRRFSTRDGFRVYGMGANFAAKRRLFDRIGLFDEVLGGGGPLRSSQDFDLQYRAFCGGAVVILSPSVKVDHYGVRTEVQWSKTLREYGIGEGAFYFKHVRCGDLFALWLLVRRVVHLAVFDGVKKLLRRRFTPYFPFYMEGVRMSLRFPVDRRGRVYRAA